MAAQTHLKYRPVDLGRLIALIDGVYAVAMTLLVLDLRLPPGYGTLSQALMHMLPGFMVYLIAFISIAAYWFMHHYTFRYISNGDIRLVLLSLLNLLFITLYPVLTSIVGAHPLEPLATVCFSANCLLYCLSAWGVWFHAASINESVEGDSDPNVLRRQARIMLVVTAFLVLAIPLAYVSVYLAYVTWVACVPLAGLIGGRRLYRQS